jgi:hypothetical protein
MMTGYKASIENNDLILAGRLTWHIEFAMAAFCSLFGIFLLVFIIIEPNTFIRDIGAMIFLILLALLMTLGCAKSMHTILYKKPNKIIIRISPEISSVSMEYHFPSARSIIHNSTLPLPWTLYCEWESNNDAAHNMNFWITHSDNEKFYLIDTMIAQTTSGSKLLLQTIARWAKESSTLYPISLSESCKKID